MERTEGPKLYDVAGRELQAIFELGTVYDLFSFSEQADVLYPHRLCSSLPPHPFLEERRMYTWLPYEQAKMASRLTVVLWRIAIAGRNQE